MFSKHWKYKAYLTKQLKQQTNPEQFSSTQVAVRNPQLKEQTLNGSPALYVFTNISLRRTLAIMCHLFLTLQSVHLKYAVK